MKIFSDRLKELRGSNSQKAFGELLGFNQQTYQRYETGVREPDLETLLHIGVTLDVSIDWLLGRTEQHSGLSAFDSPVSDLLSELKSLKRRVSHLELSSCALSRRSEAAVAS